MQCATYMKLYSINIGSAEIEERRKDKHITFFLKKSLNKSCIILLCMIDHVSLMAKINTCRHQIKFS